MSWWCGTVRPRVNVDRKDNREERVCHPPVVEDVEIFLRKVEDELAAGVRHRDGSDYFVSGDADLGVR